MNSEKMKDARVKLGLTQLDVATQVGVTNQFICQLENSIKQPSIDIAKKIASVLNLTLDELLHE